MSSIRIPAFLRPVAMVLAALVLPCCKSDIGSGDTLPQTTVRISRGLRGQEPNAPCLNPAISADGRFVVYQSAATNLAPSDGNGLVDIFLFDRATGVTTNVTRLPQGSAATPGDCTNPVVSQDGNFVGFISIGNYYPNTPDPGPHTTRMLFVLNRSTGRFQPIYSEFFPGDRDSSEPSMSSDGSAVAFVSATDNPMFGYSNPTHIPQVYHYNLTTSKMKLCSLKPGPNPNLICAAGAGSPRISPDGEYVVFSSSSSDLVPSGPTTPQIYLWSRATGTVELASLDSAGGLASTNAYLPDVSEGGRHLLFQLLGSATVPGVSAMAAVRRDRVNSITELATDHPGTVWSTYPSGFPMRISGDGRFFVYRSGDFAGNRSGSQVRQITVRDMLGGESTASRHRNGTLADADCDTPGISADGRWVVFSTLATTLVDDDFNGVTDIYVRGPLK